MRLMKKARTNFMRTDSWLATAAAKEEAFDKGYQAGALITATLIFADLDKLHLHISNEYEAKSYEALKKKYGVD